MATDVCSYELVPALGPHPFLFNTSRCMFVYRDVCFHSETKSVMGV